MIFSNDRQEPLRSSPIAKMCQLLKIASLITHQSFLHVERVAPDVMNRPRGDVFRRSSRLPLHSHSVSHSSDDIVVAYKCTISLQS